MQKRMLGAAALVGVGVLVPVLLVWWAQPSGPVAGQAVRIYEIRPSGEAVPADPPGLGAGPAAARQPAAAAPPPPALAPGTSGQNQAPETATQTPAPVAQPQPPPPEPEPPATPEPAPVSGPGWIVQVGSFAKEENARDVVGRLKDRYSVAYERAEVGGQVYYRVQVGSFASEAEAEAAAVRLRGAGYNTQVQQQ